MIKKPVTHFALAIAIGTICGLAWAESTRVTVESKDGHRTTKHVTIGTSDSVKLVRKLSDSECKEHKSWGYDRTLDLIWVDRGCRAEFEVKRADTGPKSGEIKLESGGRPAFKFLGKFKNVRLVRQLSKSPCTRDKTWGVNGKRLWVDKGCRAVFYIER